jgi:2-hydroxychromene-2-carboxylate isomerase
MASDSIDFWFTTGSTYTYLTVSRLPEIAKSSGVSFNWRPFAARTIIDRKSVV